MTQSTFKSARTSDFIAYSIRQCPDQDADWKPVGVVQGTVDPVSRKALKWYKDGCTWCPRRDSNPD